MFFPAGSVIRRPSPAKAGRLLNAISREPASLRTGRALTGAVRRIFMLSRGKHPKSRPVGGSCQRGEGGRNAVTAQRPAGVPAPPQANGGGGGLEMRLKLRLIFTFYIWRYDMKRTASLILAALLTCAALPGTALAAEAPEGMAPAATAPIFPTSVTEYSQGDARRISKVYTLSAGDDPADIPTADFEREGFTYTLLDMTRQDETETDAKAHTEAVTVESKSKDMEKIMPLLAATREVTTEDGYTGVLTLDTSSIKVEAAGYGTSSRAVTATRSYPNLSDADTAFVPKTTEESGRTLELADVQWQEAGGFYHAIATYTGTATSKYATGYTVTASYTGEVSKLASDKVIYTAVFGGAPTQTPETAEPTGPDAAEPAPSGGGWKWLLILPVGACAAGLAWLGVFLNKKHKAKKDWKEYSE